MLGCWIGDRARALDRAVPAQPHMSRALSARRLSEAASALKFPEVPPCRRAQPETPSLKLYYADHFVLPLPEGHRFPMEKYSRLRARLLECGLFADDDFTVPAAASDTEILRAHDAGYLQRVASGTLEDAEVRRIGFPWTEAMVERSRRSAGATLAATDGHAKNFSIFLLPGGGYHLTPLYDVMSAWPIIDAGPNSIPYQKTKLAMAVRSKSAHYKLAEILPRHWQAVAQRSGIPSLWEDICAMVESLPGALEQVGKELPADFPKALVEAIFDGAKHHAERFLAQA